MKSYRQELLREKFNISKLVIGITLGAFGTSFPEFIVSVLSSLKDKGEIAISNVIGSNIANITLVLGITALIFRVKISDQTVNLNYPILLFSS